MRQVTRVAVKKILARTETPCPESLALSVTSVRLGKRRSADNASAVYRLLAAEDPDFVRHSRRLHRFLAEGGSSVSGA